MVTAFAAISGYIGDGAHVRTQTIPSALFKGESSPTPPPRPFVKLLTAGSQFPARDLAVCDISGCGRKLNEIAYFADKSGSGVTSGGAACSSGADGTCSDTRSVTALTSEQRVLERARFVT